MTTFDYSALETRVVLEYLASTRVAAPPRQVMRVPLAYLTRAERRALKITAQTVALADLATIDEDADARYVFIPVERWEAAHAGKPDRAKQRAQQREHARKR